MQSLFQARQDGTYELPPIPAARERQMLALRAIDQDDDASGRWLSKFTQAHGAEHR